MNLGKEILYLSYRDVVNTQLSMSDIIDAIEESFKELGNGNVEMPPKPGIHPGSNLDNFIHAMPAYIPALKSAGVKWVSGYPGNQAKKLPYISGLLILNDPETGIPLAVMDCAWITAMRTGAASAVAAKHLANSDSSTIGILACGVQGHTNLQAMNELFPLHKVKAFDIDIEQARKLVNFGKDLGLEVEIVDNAKQAVLDSDIVVTSGPITKEPHSTIESGWIKQGAFVSLVDFDSYFSRDALRECDKWITDHIGQYLYYKDEVGFFKNCPDIYSELSQIVIQAKEGRKTKREKIFSVNLGVAIDDMAVAPLVYSRAVKNDLGTWLNL